MAKRRVGRPSKCTPSVIEKVCDAIEVGANYEDAAAVAGVCGATLRVWRDVGAEVEARIEAAGGVVELTADEERYLDFLRRFREAEARGATNMATVVYNAGTKDPAFALKWLERRRPDDWGQRDKLELTGKDGGPIQADVRFERALDKIYGQEEA